MIQTVRELPRTVQDKIERNFMQTISESSGTSFNYTNDGEYSEYSTDSFSYVTLTKDTSYENLYYINSMDDITKCDSISITNTIYPYPIFRSHFISGANVFNRKNREDTYISANTTIECDDENIIFNDRNTTQVIANPINESQINGMEPDEIESAFDGSVYTDIVMMAPISDVVETLRRHGYTVTKND